MTNGGAEKWQTPPLRHIERACGYIKDDGYIASFFCISRAEVQAIRLGMPKEQRTREPKKSEEPIAGSHAWDTKARLDSEALKRRLDNLFERFARQHGLTFECAQRMQLQGYRA